MADFLDTDMGLIFDAKGNELKATPYFEDYLYKVIASLGGEGSTRISDITNTVIAADKVDPMFSLVKSMKTQLNELDTDNPILDAKVKDIDIRTANFISKIKTVNYTAINKDWIEARNKITVYLPETPIRDDEIMISNGDGSVITIDGNGSNIKYTSTDTKFITRNNGSSYHFQYFEDNGLNERYWRVR